MNYDIFGSYKRVEYITVERVIYSSYTMINSVYTKIAAFSLATGV